MNIKDKLKEIIIEPEHMNITAEQAVRIANTNKCLKDSFFLEQLKNNLRYGYIGFTKFGVKKVIYHEVTARDEEKGQECYTEREAWFIKVLEGEWGATKFEEDPITKERIETEDWDGDFNQDENICCLIFTDNGEYLYLTKELIPYVFEKKRSRKKEIIKIEEPSRLDWLKGKGAQEKTEKDVTNLNKDNNENKDMPSWLKL